MQLVNEFGDRYPRGAEYLEQLATWSTRLDTALRSGADSNEVHRIVRELMELRERALRDHPLVREGEILVVRRRPKDMRAEARRIANLDPGLSLHPTPGREIGFPSNHECNSSLERDGYDNDLALISWSDGAPVVRVIYRPDDGGYVGEVDLDWDAGRLLFTKSDRATWRICAVDLDGGGFRVVSRLPEDVHAFDACWLPDGGIVFGCTATFQSVPCWHGLKRVANLYRMNADGTGLRQLCFDQDHDLHPAVLSNGQVVYSRWEYAGTSHIYLRLLMVMNPDGTGQRAVYGRNSWFPNALYFPQEVPGRPGVLVAILSGYHGPHRMGHLVLVDTRTDGREGEGITRISGTGQPLRREVRDHLVDDVWPRFLTPWPLNGWSFLVAGQLEPGAPWAVCYADTNDTVAVLYAEPDRAMLEPILVRPRPRPPVLPDRTDPSRQDAIVFIQNVYEGPGLADVPRGTVKALRVVAYHYGYLGLAGPDWIGRSGPWEVMRIVGTVPVEEDGSVIVRVPACVPLAFQALDGRGAAVQWMRSWYTAMPGEYVSCVGCHEPTVHSPPPELARAAVQTPRELIPWRGPPRGFSFAREVQPVLEQRCVRCHDGTRPDRPDFRPRERAPDYVGHPYERLLEQRIHPAVRKATGDRVRYSPAYDALLPYVRRVSIEDDVALLTPGEYHVDTSPLIQLLRRGHRGVTLSTEDWDRLFTWIDLNAPYYGTWSEICQIPDGAHERRLAMWALAGGPSEDPERIPSSEPYQVQDGPTTASRAGSPHMQGPSAEAMLAQEHAPAPRALGRQTLDLGGGVTLELVRLPSGRFRMGDERPDTDEYPPTVVDVASFWIGVCEVSNEQFARFDPRHSSGYYAKRHAMYDDPGLALDGPRQPVVRVSWYDAMRFCRWLSERTGRRFTLPTEAQWEYAARAGQAAAQPMVWSDLAQIGRFENVADVQFCRPAKPQITGGLMHLVLDGQIPRPAYPDDGAVVTAEVGRYLPNAWGLHDTLGNVAEWTRSRYAPYPWREDDGRNDPSGDERRVVRGGSFFDPADWCRFSIRRAYPPWRRIFNVGFRVVCEDPPETFSGSDVRPRGAMRSHSTGSSRILVLGREVRAEPCDGALRVPIHP